MMNLKLFAAFTLAATLLPITGFGGDSYTAFSRAKGKRQWNSEWTNLAIKEIEEKRVHLEKAVGKNINGFCPGYFNSSFKKRKNCWFKIFTGISAYESAFNPGAIGDKANPISRGGPAFGLFQIQARHCSKTSRGGFKANQLNNPKNNIKCGIRFGADLVLRDKVVSNEVSRQGRTKARRDFRGMAHGGWTTMRARRSIYIRYMHKSIMLGNLKEIRDGAAKFKNASLSPHQKAILELFAVIPKREDEA